MKFDESNWPIVTVMMGDTFDLDVVDTYIRNWETALARGKKFGLLLVQSSEKTEKPDREPTQRYMAWCKENKQRIAEWCAGMAMVFPSSKLLLMYKPIAALSVRKIYGCAGKAFASEAEAETWLRSELAGEGDGTS